MYKACAYVIEGTRQINSQDPEGRHPSNKLIAEQMQLPIVSFEGNMIPLAHWHCGAVANGGLVV